MIVAKRIMAAIFAMALAACGEQGSREPEALELLAPPAGAVLGARLNPVAAQRLAGLVLEADAVQGIRAADANTQADAGLRWQVAEVIPGETYAFELTAERQPVAFGSRLRIELGYPTGAEHVDCDFSVNDGAIKLLDAEGRAAERDGAWVFPCEAATAPGLQYVLVTLYPAVTYSSFVQSEAVTGAIEYRTLSFNRLQSGRAPGG